MSVDKRVIILFGPPGSGKGTQAGLIADILELPVVSASDLLRRESSSRLLSASILKMLDAGLLVPDEIVNQIVSRHLQDSTYQNGIVFDGYPRTLAQAKHLDRVLVTLSLPLPEVVELQVCEEQVYERVTARQQCLVCGKSYHRAEIPPVREGFCDNDGEALTSRNDDSDQTIRQRLWRYRAEIRDVLEYYRNHSLFSIDGAGPVNDVLRRIQASLGLQSAKF